MPVRYAEHRDIDELLSMRNHYITNSQATFDERILCEGDVRNWMEGFSNSGPYYLLVAEHQGTILGFSSSQAYRSHPAFLSTVETSIYVSPENMSTGIGTSLYKTLFHLLEGHHLHRAVVGIALPNDASVRLHTKFGFSSVGTFSEYARKNGQYISSLWMERALTAKME